MAYGFDPPKDAANRLKHGRSLAEFPGFDSEPTVVPNNRRDYGEPRFRAYGRIDGAGWCIVYTERATGPRLISLRRAHEKEMRRYER